MEDLIKKIVFKKQFSTFQPNLDLISKHRDGVQYVFEFYKIVDDKHWFRILRLKNGRRSHDFIINDFTDNNIIVENDSSKYAELQFEDKKHLYDFFLNIYSVSPFYSTFSRGDNWAVYSADENNLMNKEQFKNLFNHL